MVIDLPKQGGGEVTLNDMTTAAAASTPEVHIALIPLLKEGDKQVKNMLAVKVIGDSIRGTVIKSSNYKWYDEHATEQGINGTQLALLFMKLDEKAFGYTRFAIRDSILFRTNNKKASFANPRPEWLPTIGKM